MSGLGAACEALTSPQPCCTVTLIKHKHGPDAYTTAVPLNTTWELVFTPTFGKDWRGEEGQNLSLESLTAAQNGDKAALRDVRQICQEQEARSCKFQAQETHVLPGGASPTRAGGV